jgi:hypothetical protein
MLPLMRRILERPATKLNSYCKSRNSEEMGTRGGGGARLEDQITFAKIDLKRGRLEAAAKTFQIAVPPWGYFWRPEIARYYLEAGLPQQALDHLKETFRAEPACATWLLTTESSYWAVIRANPQARALLEKYARHPAP